MAIEYIYPTQKGLNLIAKAQAGARIEYKRAQIGEGLLPEGASINALTALVTPLKFLRLATPVVSTNQIKLPIQFSNEGIGREFWWTEIGIMANDPDEGEILAAYGNAGSRELADHFSGGLEEFVFNCILRVANAAAMEVVVDSSLAYVALSDVGRPGGVAGLDAAGKLIQMPSAADVGAAKAAHNHTAAEITSGVLGVSRGGTGQTSLANVTAGNASKLGGKVSADYALAADLAATNSELSNKANIADLGKPGGIAVLDALGNPVGAMPGNAIEQIYVYNVTPGYRDFDDYVTPNTRVTVLSVNTALSINNCPSRNSGVLEIIALSDSLLMQTYHDAMSVTYTRTNSDGAWHNWDSSDSVKQYTLTVTSDFEITLTSSTSGQTVPRYQLYKNSSMVYFYINFKCHKSLNARVDYAFGSVPQSIAPPFTVAGQGVSNITPIVLWVRSGGEVLLRPSANIAAESELEGQMTWISK